MSTAAPLMRSVSLALASSIVLVAITGTWIRPPRAAQRIIDQGDTGRAPKRSLLPRRTRRIIAALAGSLATWWAVGPLLCLALVAAGAVVNRSLPITRRHREQQRRFRAVPEALDLAVVLLQAGVTPRQVFAELGHRGPSAIQPAFATVTRQLQRGEPLADAIGVLRLELGDVITPFVELITASERYGLPTAHLVQQLSNETRALRRRHDEAAARALPVKLSFPLVTCTLPSFVLLAIAPAVLAALSSLDANAW